MGTDADGGNDPPQLGHGGVGEEFFKVCLLEGEEGTHDGGEHADDDEEYLPGEVQAEDGGEA